MESLAIKISNELPNEEEVRDFLSSRNIPQPRINAGIKILKDAVYYLKASSLLADRTGVDELPNTPIETADLINREKRKQIRANLKLYKEHAKKLSQMMMNVWAVGFDRPRDLARAEFTIGDEKRYFNLDNQSLLKIYSRVEGQLTSAAEAKKHYLNDPFNSKNSAQNYWRNYFIIECCIAWSVPLRQKHSFTTDAINDENAAVGPLPDFIMLASEEIIPIAVLDRKKLRGFLKTNREKILEKIQIKHDQLALRAERLAWHYRVQRSKQG